MPRSSFNRRIELKKRRHQRLTPLRNQKIITDESPQLVFPASGQAIDIEDQNGAKFKMTVIAKPSWVSESNSGTYQVKVQGNKSECTAYWNKTTRKWMLLSMDCD
jgi:hypothetical protein